MGSLVRLLRIKRRRKKPEGGKEQFDPFSLFFSGPLLNYHHHCLVFKKGRRNRRERKAMWNCGWMSWVPFVTPSFDQSLILLATRTTSLKKIEFRLGILSLRWIGRLMSNLIRYTHTWRVCIVSSCHFLFSSRAISFPVAIIYRSHTSIFQNIGRLLLLVRHVERCVVALFPCTVCGEWLFFRYFRGGLLMLS